jgi:anti-sigma regulatory factor (Ser/Thr protein kinase)
MSGTTTVVVRTDLDSGALVLTLRPLDSEADVLAAVDASAEQHPGAVILDLGPSPGRWASLLRGLARGCARHAVPLLVVPVLVAPTPTPVRSLASSLPISRHMSVAEALASLPSASVPSAHRRRVHLPADPSAAGEARAVVARTLSGWGLQELLFPVQLIASELVSNAVRHAHTAADLMLRLGPGGVRIAVRDGDPTPPRPPEAVEPTHEGGRGLLLVSAAAHQWGVLRGSYDKIVWAEVRPAGGSGSGVASDHGRSARRDH